MSILNISVQEPNLIFALMSKNSVLIFVMWVMDTLNTNHFDINYNFVIVLMTSSVITNTNMPMYSI